MSNYTSTVRVVSKEKYDQQKFFDVSHTTLPQLGPSSVRVRTRLVGLGSNNLAYCAAGTLLHWWDAFPVPKTLPEPFNDSPQYGISPAWGFATVLESTIAELVPGTAFWGFIPFSTLPVDLQLDQSTEVPGHWIEKSPHRQKLMPLYQRYVVCDDPFAQADKTIAAWTCTLRPVWEAGYLLNRFPFASWPGDKPVHPIPDFGQPWSSSDADIRSALVVALGAGSKTSRSFVYEAASNRHKESGPKALLEVTQADSSILTELNPAFVHEAVRYAEALTAETTNWIKKQAAERVVILDFGSRDGIVEKLTTSLRTNFGSTQIDVISIGGESKVYSAAEMAHRQETGKNLQSTRMNASGIRLAAMQQLGERQYFQQMSKAFSDMIEKETSRRRSTSDHEQILGIKLDMRKGLQGTGGLEHAWTQLCNGQIPGDKGLTFEL